MFRTPQYSPLRGVGGAEVARSHKRVEKIFCSCISTVEIGQTRINQRQKFINSRVVVSRWAATNILRAATRSLNTDNNKATAKYTMTLGASGPLGGGRPTLQNPVQNPPLSNGYRATFGRFGFSVKTACIRRQKFVPP